MCTTAPSRRCPGARGYLYSHAMFEACPRRAHLMLIQGSKGPRERREDTIVSTKTVLPPFLQRRNQVPNDPGKLEHQAATSRYPTDQSLSQPMLGILIVIG